MDEPRPTTSAAADARTASDKRRALQRRAKRGLVAGYIHGLSERHRIDTAPGREAAERSP